MKFRGVIGNTNDETIDCLLKVLTSICKIAANETLVFRINGDQIAIYVISAQRVAQTLTKCVLHRDAYFSQYIFEGSSEQNLIMFEMKSDALSQVLKSCMANIKQIKLKLNRGSDGPLLTIVVDYPSGVSDVNREVRHDLNVTLIRRQMWHLFTDPELSRNHAICLPPFKTLNTTIDRLNQMSKYLLISSKICDQKAILTIGVEADSILVKSQFKQLELHTQSARNADNNERNERNERPLQSTADVRIDLSKLTTVLNALNPVKPPYIVCNLMNSNRAHFWFYDTFVDLSFTTPHIEYS